MKILQGRLIFCMMLLVLYFGTLDFSLAFADEFRYDSHGKRDPFISQATGLAPGGHQIGHSELRLEGVIIDQKGASYAIVNSEIVKEGDLFEGYRLKRIESNRVFFEKEGDTFEVVLHQDDEMLKEYLKNEKAGN